MFDDSKICPYPGLRSFNEDESIYFKGREDHIDEVVDLLKKNKFLMVTGASGDGKSSLIFAGLVPNARAGFFKSTYTNWSVSHFRPEREPVRNFAHSLKDIFTEIPETTIETELNRGFSSLVDLYKNSHLYLDEDEANNLETEDRNALKRKCSNLLIIVDQFEEFFTNPENFHRGAPSQSAQTLINGLLETARIALNDNIPIYVVFTMRSDYIGQCSAFRGLPEYIGFSQFFVPRLKRKDLQQVIEEPANLNGDEIKRRLAERLLYDLSEGVDQLPILQHALSQIWLKASENNEPLDLIHYAMVGGMAVEELPREDQGRFKAWFDALPERKKEHFDKPGLRRVLDIHANDLYQTAWDYYSGKYPEDPISISDTKRIIALAFACLTKIDDSRAVRNLMSIDEITRIINRSHLTTTIVERVLRIFREQGNTFIRPFVEEQNPDSHQLEPEAVLDITHESLIRNWDQLNTWAQSEFDYYETFVDFEKQLNKWLESGKDRGYLLPIGPLTYFERWYENCEPNVAWIQRYLQGGNSGKKAAEILKNTQLFLGKSKRKVAVTRAFMRYGTTRLAAILAIVFVIGLSSFYYIDAERKQNEAVLEQIQSEAKELLNDPTVPDFMKGIYLTLQERVTKGSIFNSLNAIDTLDERISAANDTYTFLFDLDNKFNAPFKGELIEYISTFLDAEGITKEDRLGQRVTFLFNLVNDNYNNPGEVKSIIESERKKLLPLILELAEEKKDGPLWYNHAINHILNLSTDHPEDIQVLLKTFSPFSDDSRAVFEKNFPINAQLVNGRVGPISHNGGYQVVGSMYAALGNVDKTVQCLDTLLKYNSNYLAEENFNSAFNLIGYLLQYGHENKVEDFINTTAQKSGMDRKILMRYLMDRTGFMKQIYSYYWYEIPAYNYGLSILDREHIEHLFELHEKIIKEESSGDELHYELALLYKQRGVYAHRYMVDQELAIDSAAIYPWFDKAIQSYLQVSDTYRMGTKNIEYRYYLDGFRDMDKPRAYCFLYPDQLDSHWYNDKYTSPVYAEYVMGSDYFDELYTSGADLEVFNDWISNYYEVYNINNAPNARRNLPNLGRNILVKLHQLTTDNDRYGKFDRTFINLLLANAYFAYGEKEQGLNHYTEINQAQLQPLVTRWEYLNYTFIQNRILELAKYLSRERMYQESKDLLENMMNNNDRSISYTEVAMDIFKGENKEEAFVFLDSAISKGKKTDHSVMPLQLSYRYYLIRALSGIGGKAMNDMSNEIFNQVPIDARDFAINYEISGMAFEGNYFRAKENVPTLGPRMNRLYLYSFIFAEEAARNGKREGWDQFDMAWDFYSKTNVPFDDNY